MIIIDQYILRYLYATVQNINYLLLTVIWKLFQEGSESLLYFLNKKETCQRKKTCDNYDLFAVYEVELSIFFCIHRYSLEKPNCMFCAHKLQPL